MKVKIIPCLKDNYSYLIIDDKNNKSCVIDPSEATPIIEFLEKNNIKFPVLGKPIRYLLINNYNGPSITDIFMILGKRKSIERLNRYKI